MLVTKNLGAQIYQQLRHELMAGHYEPGQKLKLRDLAERLGVSVTPVREALARLVSDQALVQVDHHSVCVAMMDLPGYAEVRELRLDLEGKAAEHAAGSAAPAEIAELRLIHERLLEARATGAQASILLENQNFHLALCRFAHMPVLLHLVEMLWLQCGPLMHGMTRWPVRQPKQHPHVTVIEALEARDGKLAREAIQQDIVMSTEALRLYLMSHTDRPEWARRSLRLISEAVPAAAGRRRTLAAQRSLHLRE